MSRQKLLQSFNIWTAHINHLGNYFMAGHLFTLKDPFRVMVEFRFWELESFIHISQKASEEFTRRSKGDLEETISRAIEENKSADPVVIVQIHSVADYVTAHHETIPRYLGYSFVIHVYNLFEELGKKLHKELMQREIISKAPELQSNDFLASFKVFTEQAGIAFVEYPTIQDFKDVRNNIVHRAGNLAGETRRKQENLRRVVERNGTTLSVCDGQIRVATAYVIENLNLIKQFFSKALNQMKFEDGFWSKPSKTPFAVFFREGKVTIDIEGSNAGS
jgi:hypothetical protein